MRRTITLPSPIYKGQPLTVILIHFGPLPCQLFDFVMGLTSADILLKYSDIGELAPINYWYLLV